MTHCTSVAPVQFLLSPIEVTQLQTFLFSSNESPFHWIMVLTFVCVFIFVPRTMIEPTGLESLHKTLPSTTWYYKACTKYFPVLLRTTKLAQSTSQYFFVPQSLHKVVPSTTSYYKACTKYSPVLLHRTKLAQSTSHHYLKYKSTASAKKRNRSPRTQTLCVLSGKRSLRCGVKLARVRDGLRRRRFSG